MYKIFITAILGIMASEACMAQNFNHDDDDDDTTIQVTKSDWDDGIAAYSLDQGSTNTGINVEFVDATSGIGKVTTGGTLLIRLSAGSLVIESATKCPLPVYDVRGRIVKTLSVNPGTNTFDMQSGIYIIKGRKFKL